LTSQFGADAPSLAEESDTDALWLDESAFRVLYEQTSGPLFRYLLSMTRERALAEDLLQETYCRFLTARVTEMSACEARSYLFRIATNLMRDRWRRPDVELSQEHSSEDSRELGPSDEALERRLGMRQAFDRLKPRERQLLWLAYVEGSNHREIADCTGLRAGSIRLLLFRARHKLAELIRGGSEEHRSKGRR
jgi:RNA polymerase sigma-70 factor (ECF subfamily)